MENPEQYGFVPKQEQDPAQIAMKHWGVDLNDDHAVLQKLQEMQGKMPDVADLSNLWQKLQEERDEKKEVKKAA